MEAHAFKQPSRSVDVDDVDNIRLEVRQIEASKTIRLPPISQSLLPPVKTWYRLTIRI